MKMANSLLTTNSELLGQLKMILNQFSNGEFAKPLPILSNSSVGMHVRHIIEFYQCLLEGYDIGIIDFDRRKRNKQIEESMHEALQETELIHFRLLAMPDKSLLLLSNLTGVENKDLGLTTSFHRELVYVIEHTIHHFAIIKIAILNEFQNINLPKNFGVAYSTIQHLASQH